MLGNITATFDAGVWPPALELTRRFRQPIEKVWAALTLPGRLSEWMDVEWLGEHAALHEGAAFDYRFRSNGIESRGRVLRFEPPYLLEHSWFDNLPPASIIRWELAADGAGCRLTLTQRFGQADDAPRNAAGWSTLLDALAACVGDTPASPPAWHQLRDGFAQSFPPEATRDARIVEIDGAKSLRFERRLRHACTAVWNALVEPPAIARWLQADAFVEPFAGGRFELKFHGGDHAMNGRITRWEPPHVLEYTWPENAANGDSIVRFELSPAHAGCVLVLTHMLRGGGEFADFASGWHWHLDALDAALLGEARAFDKPRWAALRQIYLGTL